jgi:uncharacterized membrane protein
MKKRNKVVFGIYKTHNDSEIAVKALKNNGFRASDISVLLPQPIGAQNFFHTKSSKAPEGAATGGGAGVIVGGLLGLLVGVGTFTIPGVGPFIAAGPLVTALAGLGIGGAMGALSGAFIGYGIPEYEAKRYEGIVKDGGILLSVHVDDAKWAEKAFVALELTGAKDIAESHEIRSDSDYKKVRMYQDSASESLTH